MDDEFPVYWFLDKTASQLSNCLGWQITVSKILTGFLHPNCLGKDIHSTGEIMLKHTNGLRFKSSICVSSTEMVSRGAGDQDN